mgnify:CR=1 FL=1
MVNNWRFDNGSKKKLRGLNRRYKTLIKELEDNMETMLDLNESSLGYWHEHLPFNQEYVDSKKTPNSFRRGIMQTLIDQVVHLVSIKKDVQTDYRIYTVISLPSLFDSQIAILPDESWFEGYFERNSEEHKWIPLDKDRDLIKEWHLKAPSKLEVKGFKEIVSDEDYYHEGEVWFIGELS